MGGQRTLALRETFKEGVALSHIGHRALRRNPYFWAAAVSIDSRFLPERFRRLMQSADLAKIDEASIRAIAATEIQEQKIFNAWLNRQLVERKLYPINPRSDKATTIRVGHPDYTLFLPQGKTLLLEMKAEGGKLRSEQIDCIELLSELGHRVEIPWSAAQAIDLVKASLSEKQ
jgi:VRR-NUC domain